MSSLTDFTLGERLYSGASSVVYRARRLADGASVVIKLLQNDNPSSHEVAQIEHEHAILSKRTIAGVVKPLGLLRDRRQLGIVMADVGASAVGTHLARGRMGLGDVLHIGSRAARILAELHRNRIVHGDVNPANILFDPASKNVWFIDFGIAFELSRDQIAMESSGMIRGTLRYIAPEQTGRMNRSVDQTSDLYSLGVTLYEMLLGSPPFSTMDPMELVHCHIAKTPRPPHEADPSIPQAVSRIVMKLLAKNPEERYQSAYGLAADLDTCLAHDNGRTLENFVPGTHDGSDRFRIPQKLYGRDKDRHKLLTAFEQASVGQAQLLLVTGYSGIGKSTLVHEVDRPIVEKNGYFVSGKFNQQKRNAPYASIIDAFHDLIRQLLTEREERLTSWRDRYNQLMGANGSVIADVIPAVELLMGKLPPAPQLPPADAQRRFLFAFEQFVRVFATLEHPLVVFLDDLQWADAGSLTLIENLMTAGNLEHFLLIGAYRDNEVTEGHQLLPVIENIRRGTTPISTIELVPLDTHAVTQIISDTTHCEEAEALALSQHLSRITGGNPFFLSQMLRKLHDDQLITFDQEKRRFGWDIEAIRQHPMTADVVELMANKIRKLSESAQRMLRLAACIGNRFDVATLAVVANVSHAEALGTLREVVEEGLIVPFGDQLPTSISSGLAGEPRRVFRFFHDRMQQAAYAFIPEADRAQIHLGLGRMLLAATTPETLPEHIFEIVPHFDLGRDAIVEDDERYAAADLAQLAGKRALDAAAWEPALRYLTAGLDLLPKDAFEKRRELAFTLHGDAAETEYLNGNVDRADKLAALAMEQAQTVMEKVRVFELQMLFGLNRNQLVRVVEAGLSALDLLDVHFERTVGPAEIGQALGHAHQVLNGRNAAELWDLPELVDPQKLAALRIISTIVAPTYMVNPPLFVVVVAKYFAICAEHGNSRYSPMAYTMYSTVLMGVVGNTAAASEYAELAHRLLDRFGAWVSRAFVYLTTTIFVFAWKSHYRDTLDQLRIGTRSGIETGDLQHAGYCAINSANFMFWAGDPLEAAAAEYKQSLGMFTRYKLEFHSVYLRTFVQSVENLLGRTKTPLKLEGEAFSESKELPELEQAQNIGTLMVFHTNRLALAVIFREIASAVRDAEVAEKYAGGQQGQTPFAQHAFYQSLALLSFCATASDAERTVALEKVDKHVALLTKWASDAPMNFEHKLELIRAERARLDGRFSDAFDHYERALQGAAKHRFTHEEALTHELCAEYCVARGWERTAESHWIEAHRAYGRWGAKAKVEWLERHHPGLFAIGNVRQRNLTDVTVTTSKSSTGVELELSSIMKAARTISGEIVLGRLVAKLMRIMVENAGAQRGVLFLEQNGRLLIVAEWMLGQTEEPTGQFKTLAENETRIPTAIVQYVVRTGESIVLGNATSTGIFTKDPYVVRTNPRSVLCAPLSNQGRRIGVVYLENNLVQDAFTAERLQVLELLSAQAALSIQNAEAFATLEQRVVERTVELSERNKDLSEALDKLKEAQEQLVMQEKLAALGTTTAGIAHEIKNPLNFINNFAQSAVDLTAELMDSIEKNRDALSDDIASELDEVLPMLQQSVQKIDEHGRRANGILGQMLLHARGERSVREIVDLNQLVARALPLGLDAIQRRDAHLGIKLDTDLDTAIGNVRLAPQDFTRVIVNLISNAAYALHEKRRNAGVGFTPTIRVSTRKNEGRVELRIHDNGTGIAPNAVKRIFEPFFTTKPSGDGTGLGLSIVHDIVVRDHRGNIEVNTKQGEFTELVVLLPM